MAQSKFYDVLMELEERLKKQNTFEAINNAKTMFGFKVNFYKQYTIYILVYIYFKIHFNFLFN